MNTVFSGSANDVGNVGCLGTSHTRNNSSELIAQHFQLSSPGLLGIRDQLGRRTQDDWTRISSTLEEQSSLCQNMRSSMLI